MQSKEAPEWIMDERLGKLLICPYQKSHRVPESRFMIHLLKCRRNFQVRLQLAGKRVPMFSCKYNSLHEMTAPELAHHEATCKDRDKIWSYQLNLMPLREQLQHDWLKRYDLEKLRPDQKEVDEMYRGFHLGSVIGTEFLGEQQDLNDLKKSTEEDDQEKAWKLRAKYSPMWRSVCAKAEEIDDGDKAEASGGATAESPGNTEATQTEEGDQKDDSEEDWGKECKNGPPFDYVKNIWNPNTRHSQMPSGLSKKEKELFLKIHGKRMEKEWEDRQRQQAAASRTRRSRRLAGFTLQTEQDFIPGFRDEDIEYF